MAVPLAIILGLNLFGLFINVISSPVTVTEDVFTDDIHLGNLTAEPSSVPSTINGSNAGSVICNGWKYGHNPPKASCEEAWHSIPRSGQRLIFGRRGDAAVSKPLPIRWLSSDGHCGFDVGLEPAASRGSASEEEISEAALELIEKCAVERHVGGLATSIGPDTRLNVDLSVFHPQVRCSGRTRGSYTRCTALESTFLAGTAPTSFGRRQSRRVQVALPVKQTDPTHECTAIVDMIDTGDADQSSWYDIWAALVAVNSMCIKRNKNGLAFGLGRQQKIILSVNLNPPIRDSSESVLPANVTSATLGSVPLVID